jgi:hypothetical protein
MQHHLQITTTIKRMVESGAFDAQWYLDHYPDVRQSRLSPAEHYLLVGQLLGRQPRADADASAGGTPPKATWALPVEPRRRALPGRQARHAILASGLFDAAWYQTRIGTTFASDEAALDHYCQAEDDWDTPPAGALFSSAHYRAENPDIGSHSPLAHAALHGLQEGRRVFDPALVDAFLERHATTASARLADVIDVTRPAMIFCWDQGNFFFAEIARYLEVLLTRLGVDARLGAENEMPAAGITPIVVAPHEFCVHGAGRLWPEELQSRTVPVNTEQWHTGWFTHALRFIRKSGVGLDINPSSASGLAALGYRVAFVPLVELGPFQVDRAPLSPEFAAARAIEPLTYPAAAADRPYALLFIGACNARRSGLLGALAPDLARHQAFVHCPRFDGPVRAGDPDAMRTSDAVQLARNARILLNLHQGEGRYFEWHRLFLLGIAKGCVVVSEPCLPNPWVIEGTHYICCEADRLAETINWLLGTTEGSAECDRIRRNGAELVARLNAIEALLA